MKKIVNIVFYKSYENGVEKREACIFYRDGSVANVSYDDGITACEEIVKERKITSKDVFKEMINREIVHVMSKSEFMNKFNTFISNEPLDRETIDETIEEKIADTKEETEDDELDDEFVSGLEENNITPINPNTKIEIPAEDSDNTEDNEDEEDLDDIDDLDDFYEDTDDEDIELDIEDDLEEKEERKGIIGFFQRQIDKIKNSKLVRRITLFALGVAVGLGLYSCSAKQTKDGRMLNSNIESTTLDNNDSDIEVNPQDQQVIIRAANDNEKEVEANEEMTTIQPTTEVINPIEANNELYNGYTFEQLLNVTNNETQKRAMTNVRNALQGFNINFANAHLEEGKNVRAALSFEEVIALQQAYNDYSKEEIRAIFNGHEVNATKLSRAYKDASLQLMGAYVIENSENPVDMSMLIESEEGKEFYQRYHQLFLAAKEATGDEKLANIRAFYDAVRTDFPITEKVRTEGISHADDYALVIDQPYKFSVVSMIAAAEMMWQNEKVDFTLQGGEEYNDIGEINFLNDIGFCDEATQKYERIETIMLSVCESDKTNPLYEQYREAIIRELGEYYDLTHRELTELDAFQREVNGHFNEAEGEWIYVGGYSETTETHQETHTWTEQHTTTREEIVRTEEDIPQEERDRIDDEIEEENEENRRVAEEIAEEERRRRQEEEDRNREQIEEEIRQEEEDLEERIDEANEQIERNQDNDPSNDNPVNEADFGDHNVHFDDEHSDSQGNLDDSVENITTDPTGDQTGEELPDPNKTGEEFDRAGNELQYQEPAKEDEVFVEYEEPVQENTQEEQVQERVVEESYEEPAQQQEEQVVVEESYEEPAQQQEEQQVQERVVEETYEEPVQQEEYHEESVQENNTPSEDVGYVEYVDENNYIEYPSDYTPVVEYEEPVVVEAAPTNEEIVDAYVEAMAEEVYQEDETQYTK